MSTAPYEVLEAARTSAGMSFVDLWIDYFSLQERFESRMTDRGGSGHRSQLIIWAAAEARRLRRQTTPVDEEPQVERQVAAGAPDVVLDRHLSFEPVGESSA